MDRPSRVVLAFALLAGLALLGGCAAAPIAPAGETLEPPVVELPEELADEDFAIDIHDPWEGWNRRVYRFNAEFDRVVFLPVVETYEFVVPEPARDSVTNFFDNLDNLITFANQLLQGRPMAAAQTVFRFAVNSSVGVLGLFDPSSAIGVPKHEEDFGQTMGVWGAEEGPYMVLPVLGPSNLRDTAGMAVDQIAFTLIDPFGAASFQSDYPFILALNAIDTRANIGFRYHQTGSPFEYELVRFLYTKKRRLDIKR